MSRSSHGSRTLLVAFGLLLCARTAAAQPAAYITGSAFADIKRFGSTQGVRYFADDEEFSLDGTGAGGGLRIGTFLTPRWSLELAADAGSKTEVEFSDPYVILAIYPSPIRDLEFKASTKFLAVSTILGFHPQAHGRVQLGYLAGFSFIRGTYKSNSFVGPVPLVPYRIETISTTRLLAPSRLIFPPPRLTTRTQKHNTGGLILGLEAAVTLTSRLAVVPEVRALTFSTVNNGPVVFLFRPGIGVRWNF